MWHGLHTLIRSAFVIFFATCICSHAAASTVDFNIPSGPAQTTLFEFYLQSKVRILYLQDTIKGIETHAVSGQLEPREALALMLQGTGLICEFDTANSALIKPCLVKRDRCSTSCNAPSPGDGPHVPPQSQKTRSETKLQIRSETKLQEFLITGSLIHGVLDITSPLISVDRKDMKRTAYATVQDAVQVLPITAGSSRGEVIGGTGNYGRGTPINLRGLGDGATLVLVNGRRQPSAGLNGDFVDVSNIPWSMVDHMEVLPDGGSALYGSDAIAGVVNIIMRTDLEGAESQLRFGTAPDGAAETVAAQLLGHKWSTGKYLLAYQYYNRTALAASDRDYAATADKRPLGGSDYRSIRANPGNILDPRTLQPVFALPRGQDDTSLSPGDLLPGTINYRNRFDDVELLPDRHMHSVYFTASQRLSDHIELFTEQRFSQRDIRQRPLLPDQGYPLLLVPSTNPFFVDPFGGSPFVIVAYDFANDLGPLRGAGRTRNYFGSLGLKFDFGGSWQASLSGSYGEESMNWTDYGQVNAAALNAALADPSSATAFNPFGDGSHTNPSTINAIQFINDLESTNQLSSFQFNADGPLFDLPSGTAKLAVGGEYRIESLERRTTIHSLLDRNIAAAFAELSIPVIGNFSDTHAVPRLELSLAGRYEHYNDFGDTFNPKIGLRWAPLTSIKLRASWGTSYRAPNLVDLDSTRNIAAVVPLKDPLSPSGHSNALFLQGGNSDLKEERATTWTAGIDLAPQALPGFRASITGYAIEYKDQVIQPGPLSPLDILLQENQWSPVITRNPSLAQIQAICSSPQYVSAPCSSSNPPTVIIDIRKRNLAITRVNGIDLGLSQSYDHFNFGLDGTYILHFQRAFTRTAPVVDVVDTVNNPLALRVRGVLEWHQRRKDQTGFGLTFAANYAGSYQNRDSPVQHSVDALTTFDLGLSYRTERHGNWADNTEIVLSVVNLSNEDPPFVDSEWGYDVTNAQPTGRVLSAYVSKRW